jgi:hypothetical protein
MKRGKIPAWDGSRAANPMDLRVDLIESPFEDDDSRVRSFPYPVLPPHEVQSLQARQAS